MDLLSHLNCSIAREIAEEIDRDLMKCAMAHWLKTSPLSKWPGWSEPTARNLAKSITFYGKRRKK